MLRKLLLPLLFVGFFAVGAFAQTGSITGTVTNQDGEPVPTANVLLEEINRGIGTNLAGEYTIDDVPTGTYTLRVTFVGYQEYSEQVTVQAGQTTTADVVLQLGAVGLDQLVVTGYGVQTEGELTGSIASIAAEEFEDVPVQNVGSVLQGRVAGVQMSTTSGNPGGGFNIQIRGIGSISAGTQPLFIVDGVQLSSGFGSIYSDQSPLNSIGVDNIASIEVLKDAAATAIYGSQAANGVVLVTTKSGVAGATQVSLSIEQGTSTIIDNLEFMEPDEWLDFQIESLANVLGTRAAGEAYFRANLLPSYGYSSDIAFENLNTTDWLDFATDPGLAQSYQLSFSGGSEETRFYVAGSYDNVEGTVLNNKYIDYRLRTNLEHQVSSDFLLDANLGISTQANSAICQDGNFINCPVTAAYFEPPISFPYNEDGSYNPFTQFGLANNLAVLKNEVSRETNVLRLLGNLGGTYELTDAFALSGLVGMDYKNFRDKRFDSRIADASAGGAVTEALSTTVNFNAQLTLNFVHTFNEVHNIDGFVGTEYRRDYNRYLIAGGNGIVPGFNVLDATASPVTAAGFTTEYRLASYFGTVGYDYDDRYLLQFTGRYDGSSKFGLENRWGFFPSFSAAWRISEEEFFDSNTIDALKLRASYGITGNSAIDNFAARYLFDLGGSYLGTGAVTPFQLPNVNLTWEESQQLNVGLDFALFSNRLSGTVNVYRKESDKLLLGRPIPADNGYNEITSNVGAVLNKGIEFSLNSVNFQSGDFIWRSSFNISFNENEVLELNEGQDQIGSGFSGPLVVGQSLGVFWVPEFAGINPADGRPFWYDANGDLTYQPTIDDRIFVDGSPDATGGFGNTFSYKGLSLNVLFQFSAGGRAFDQSLWYFSRTAAIGGNIFAYIAEDRWQNPGDVTYVPYAKFNSVYPGGSDYRVTPGTHMIYDTGYIRLKTAKLGYSLPTSLTEQLNLRGIQVYVTGINLITWTQWPGLDPEVTYNPDFGTAGAYITAGSYPTRRQINAGIKIDF